MGRIKLQSLTIPELVVVTLIGTLNFALMLVVSLALPTLPPFVAIFFIALLNVLCRLIVDKFGAITLAYLAFTALSIPTPIFGIPGPHHLLFGLVTGLACDIALSVTQGRNSLLRGALYGIVDTIVMTPLSSLITFLLFHDPLAKQMIQGLMVTFILISLVVQIPGGIVGALVYNSIRERQIVRMIRAWKK